MTDLKVRQLVREIIREGKLDDIVFYEDGPWIYYLPHYIRVYFPKTAQRTTSLRTYYAVELYWSNNECDAFTFASQEEAQQLVDQWKMAKIATSGVLG